jgi:hypothetical protein
MLLRIAATRTHKTAALRNAHSIAKWARELTGLSPVSMRRFKRPNAVVPHFLPALPRHSIWKIRTARHEESAIADACKSCGYTELIRNRRELSPRREVNGSIERSHLQ